MAAAGPSSYPVDSFTSDRDPSHTTPRLFIIPRGPGLLAAGRRRRLACTTESSIEPQLMHRVAEHMRSASPLNSPKVSRTSNPLQR